MRAVLLLALLVALPGCLSGAGDAGLVGGDDCPRTHTPLTQEVRVRNQAGGGRVGDGASQEVPFPLDWRGDASCVRAVEVTVAWTNTPEAGADLHVGYRFPSEGLEVVGHDRQQFVADGSHEERVLGPPPASGSALASDLVVMLYTDWASLSATGLPATVTVRLLLD